MIIPNQNRNEFRGKKYQTNLNRISYNNACGFKGHVPGRTCTGAYREGSFPGRVPARIGKGPSVSRFVHGIKITNLGKFFVSLTEYRDAVREIFP